MFFVVCKKKRLFTTLVQSLERIVLNKFEINSNFTISVLNFNQLFINRNRTTANPGIELPINISGAPGGDSISQFQFPIFEFLNNQHIVPQIIVEISIPDHVFKIIRTD